MRVIKNGLLVKPFVKGDKVKVISGGFNSPATGYIGYVWDNTKFDENTTFHQYYGAKAHVLIKTFNCVYGLQEGYILQRYE